MCEEDPVMCYVICVESLLQLVYLCYSEEDPVICNLYVCRRCLLEDAGKLIEAVNKSPVSFM